MKSPFRIPVAVWVIALAAAVLHMAPHWRAESQVPPGWTFTGNLKGSPDYMQYRVWMRQTQESGILVANKFTSEPSQPYLPVAFYFTIAKIAGLLQLPPEYVYAYLGSLFAFLFTIVLYVVVRHFMADPYRTWWVFGAIALGGGLGAHLKILASLEAIKESYLLNRLLVEPVQSWPLFENHRGVYPFVALFDTHYLMMWLLTTVTVMAFYLTVRRFTLVRLCLTMALFAALTLLHVYEAVTLMMICAAITGLCWWKGVAGRSLFVTFATCSLCSVICLGFLAWLHHSSGLPLPPWRAHSILLSTFLLGYPLAWLLLAWGLPAYYRRAGFDECFLLGWVLGCAILTLSGPFYPYPDRGTMTLQLPLMLVGGAIYFSRYQRVSPIAAIAAVMLLGATPALKLTKEWLNSGFGAEIPWTFLSTEHQEIVRLLRERAGENDLLIVSKTEQDWKTDDLWLAPDYPGKLYCGHFFLTVNYQDKRAQVNDFFERDDPVKQLAFLQRENIRFVFVNAKQEPERFRRIPELVPLKACSVGQLFEYFPGVVDASRGTVD